MHYQSNKTKTSAGLTLLEMVLALAITVIIFAALLPPFRAMLNSWDSKQGNAEALQNGRVLIDHINRNLAKAVRITSVSASDETAGYIEFEDNDGNTLRYDIVSSYVQFGIVDSLSDLAGPVSQLQFTCYDGNDFVNPITDVNSIRFIEVQTMLTNSASRAPDKTFTSKIYLRTNSEQRITKETPFEYDTTLGANPALVQVDSTHYLCAYEGSGSDGWAVVLTVDTNNWTISKGTAFEYDGDKGATPALCQIDNTHYLCVYADKFSDGQAVVLTVNTGTWNITMETPFEYDTDNAETPALSKIDDTHYLCVYTDKFSDGQAVVLTVNTGTWNITKETNFEYDTDQAVTPALSQIDTTHYLCAYSSSGLDGWVTVLTVDTNTWEITKETPFEFDSTITNNPALSQIDATHYLCAYSGVGDDGWATVLMVDTDTWGITKGTLFEFDTAKGDNPALAQIDTTHYLCAYSGSGDDGWATVLTVNTATWEITKWTPFEYDTVMGKTPALAQVNDRCYLCTYSGSGDDGWSVVLKADTSLRP